MKTILITGGAGFVGSSLALALKSGQSSTRVIAFDNLYRRGSELNLPRLAAGGVEFVHGDVRSRADLDALTLTHGLDALVECSAEPSVLSGYGGSPDYLVQTNLSGALNCLELARRHQSAFVFLSTSRVYPSAAVDALAVQETATRFELAPPPSTLGASSRGISETFPLTGARSLYGATKLAAEVMVTEYADAYGLPAVINRCGVIAGPWQMGKVDQGFLVFWAAKHIFGGSLTYLGYGGAGKQVRDILHVADLADLVAMQLERRSELTGQVVNAGGGRDISVSLAELTTLCQARTGKTIPVAGDPTQRRHDIRVYLSDCASLFNWLPWQPTRSVEVIVDDVVGWIEKNRATLEPILR